MAIETPSYFKYYAQTVELDDTPDGGLTARRLNLKTGELEPAEVGLIDEVLFATDSGDISRLDENRFVQETEAARQRYLRGDGPIFALYDTIKGLQEQARAEGRGLAPEERALISSLRSRTYEMWREEFARRANGEPPSFDYTSTASS